MSLSIFTNWGVGVINGYTHKENGLPNDIKYGTIGLTTCLSIFKGIGHLEPSSILSRNISNIPLGQRLAGLCIGIPLLIGANFCLGHGMGKAIRYAKDNSK
jgi:hypothetical protein